MQYEFNEEPKVLHWGTHKPYSVHGSVFIYCYGELPTWYGIKGPNIYKVQAMEMC